MSEANPELTFLFTDVAGSTRLWEEHPAAMGRVLHQHDVVLRQVIEAHGGHVFKALGDAFCAAFDAPRAALAAAVDGQIALREGKWEPPGPLHVRMAIHSGVAEERGGDYFGPPLNRCARILGVAHGDQVLLSSATRAALPRAVELTDLGGHRLRDLTEPERLYQVRHPDLPGAFPPLASLDALPNNLPVMHSVLVGRDAELEEITDMLEGCSLLTLAGIGGVGKTRLALQTAAEVMDRFADGTWFIELDSFDDPEQVPQAAATVLGVRESADNPLERALLDHLHQQETLLVLDNCEHLVAGAARFAEAVLRHCGRVKILATSREALRIDGEVVWPVPTLPWPEPSKGGTGAADLVGEVGQYPATKLFVERARAAVPSFAVTADSAPSIVQVCARLDGIPLAIELAAARVKVLSVPQIADRLDERFRLLTGGARTALPRQQTLKGAIDWSYELLNEVQRSLLQRLSVFRGGWSLEAAEGVCADDGLEAWDVLDALERLVERSLVLAEMTTAAPRYRMLESIRQYAKERLQEEGDAARVRARHRAWAAALSAEAEPALKGADQAAWLDRLDLERDNLAAALRRAADESDAEVGLAIAGRVWRFWYIRGYFSQGRYQIERLLAVAADDPSAARASALHAYGTLALYQGDFVAGRAALEECLAIQRALGNKKGEAAAISNLAIGAHDAGEDELALRLFDESLALKRQLGDEWGIANSLLNIGTLDEERGDIRRARQHYEEALALYTSLHDSDGIAAVLQVLARVSGVAGDLEQAASMYEEALTVLRRLGSLRRTAVTQREAGVVAFYAGFIEDALARLGEAEALARSLDDTRGVALTKSWIGRVLTSVGRLDEALHELDVGVEMCLGLGSEQATGHLLEGRGVAATADGQVQSGRSDVLESVRLRAKIGRLLPLIEALEALVVIEGPYGDAGAALALYAAMSAVRADMGLPLPNPRAAMLQPAVQAAEARATSATEARSAAPATMEDALRLALGTTLGSRPRDWRGAS